MSATDDSTVATTAPAATATSAPTITPASAPAPVPSAAPARPYNPNANLSQLDPTATLPDESENARLSAELDHNVKNMLATKMENERKAQKFGTLLAQKAKLMEEEARKLSYVRSELQKLDQSFSRNIDMIRTEIEGVGREVNSLQKEFDYKEREYLECRKALAKVKQRKLLLNSHLDYIIMTNENEKAAKLQELERTLGLAPSTSPPPPGTNGAPAFALPDANSVAQQAKQAIQAAGVPPPAVNAPSAGPSPAVLAAAAENARKHAAANAANAIDKDHSGLKLDVLAPPGFGGFDAAEADHSHQPQIQQQQQQQQQQTPQQPSSYSGTNPFGPPTPTENSAPKQYQQQIPSGPSPASVAASRHVSMPPRSATSASNSSNSSLSTSNPFAQQQQQQQAPRSASSALSIANKKSGTPLSFTSDGTFAGFAD